MTDGSDSFIGAAESVFKVGIGVGIAIGVVNFIDKVAKSTRADKENRIKWF